MKAALEPIPRIDGANKRPPIFQRILVAVDFSEGSRLALHYAAELAAQSAASLTLVHVVEPGLPPLAITAAAITSARSPERQCAQACAELRELSESVINVCRVVETAVRCGIAFFEITETAKALGADLIITGTRGRTGLQHALLGSTAEKIIRHAPCPVLVVRQPQLEAVI